VLGSSVRPRAAWQQRALHAGGELAEQLQVRLHGRVRRRPLGRVQLGVVVGTWHYQAAVTDHNPDIACAMDVAFGQAVGTEAELNMPDLLTSDERTFCQRCRKKRFGAGVYEPE
jgi:hypothetical protein